MYIAHMLFEYEFNDIMDNRKEQIACQLRTIIKQGDFDIDRCIDNQNGHIIACRRR